MAKQKERKNNPPHEVPLKINGDLADVLFASVGKKKPASKKAAKKKK